MRKLTFAGVFILLVLLFAGCSITVGGGDSERVSRSGPDSATLAEIDAAANLTFDDDKEEAFIRIARRPHLTGQAQVYLVKKAMRSLTFDDAKRDVLLALVDNPYFVAEGKQAVLEHLDALVFNSGKQKVLGAIDRRGYVPTERELEMRLREQRLREQQPEQSEEPLQMETTVEMEVGHMEKL